MTARIETGLSSTLAPRPAILFQDADRFIATEDAAGPWSPGHCHGGVPAALITRIAEQTPSLVPMEIARVSIELFRPVPTSELTARTEVVREGKKLQLVSIDIEAHGAVVARGSVLKLRAAAQAVDADLLAIDHGIQPPEDLPLDQPRFNGGFARQFELRVARGAFRQPGPATVWFRLQGALFDDVPAAATWVAAAVADFSNGASTALSFADWTFLNADLTLNFFRAPVGEWIAIDAETCIGPLGRALACSRLADRQGWFGQATQSLLLQPR